MRCPSLLPGLLALGALALAACGDENITEPDKLPMLSKATATTVVDFEDGSPDVVCTSETHVFGPISYSGANVNTAPDRCGAGTVAHSGAWYAYPYGGYIPIYFAAPVHQVTCYFSTVRAVQIEARDASDIRVGRAIKLAGTSGPSGPLSVDAWKRVSFRVGGNRIAKLMIINVTDGGAAVFMDDCTLVTEVPQT